MVPHRADHRLTPGKPTNPSSPAPRFASQGTTPAIRLARHDRLQAELKLHYAVPDVLAERASYELDMWLHLPSPLGIGAGQGSVESVYEDLRVFSRLKTPEVPLRNLLDPAGEGSPVTALAILVGAPERQRAWARDVRREARLVARVFRSASRYHLAQAGRRPGEAFERLELLARTSEALGPRFRAIAAELRALGLDPPTALCLDASDEYLSVQLELSCTRAIALLDRADTSDPALRQRLVAVVHRETEHRRQAGLRSAVPPAHGRGQDAFLDQVGLLKRYVERVLLLRPEASQRHTVARNAILGLAAALAMAWAVGLQVFALYSLGLDLSSGASTSIVVAFSTVAVLGYILKDRIKAWSAEVLARQLPRYLDDRGATLVWGIHRTELGRVSERVTFEPSHGIDPRVHQQHVEAMGTPLAAEVYDDVLHYRRRVVLLPRAALTEFPRFAGVNEALRINVARWVRTLSAPKRSIVVLDPHDKPRVRKLPNHYLVPVVIRLRVASATGVPTELWTVHRIVLSQRGIVRVEALGPQPPLESVGPGTYI